MIAKFGILIIIALCVSQIYCQASEVYKKAPKRQQNNNDKEIYELPKFFDWRSVNGTNYLTIDRNQHIPQYCGSCWAHSTTSSLSDRIKIMRKAQFPDINLAPQIIISCVTTKTKYCEKEEFCHGCHGGEPVVAWEYIKNEGIYDETCSVYLGRGYEQGSMDECSKMKCYTFKGFDKQKLVIEDAARKYTIEKYYTFQGEKDMMNEIIQNGPIHCALDSIQSFDDYQKGIYINRNESEIAPSHDISVVGWGEENNTKYWIVRNSWGTFWGEKGYVRVIRGINSIGIESYCSAAIPKDTWSQKEKPVAEQLNIKKFDFLYPRTVNSTFALNIKERISQPKAHETLGENFAFPTNFFWGNIQGVNYLSWSKNQHIPIFCGSCWAQSATSALADRFNILFRNKWPQVNLEPQIMLNFHPNNSTCHRGVNIMDTYEYIYQNGIGDNTCNQYIARDPSHPDINKAYSQNEDKKRCQTCWPTSAFFPEPGKEVPQWPQTGGIGEFGSTCSEMKNYTNYFVQGYGSLVGEAQMKAEIFANGPIICGIQATQQYDNYYNQAEDAIFIPDLNKFTGITHIISVVGWGEKVLPDGQVQKYWIARNSWGTFWGYRGYFKLLRGADIPLEKNLGIETICAYAIPTLKPQKNSKEAIPF